MKSFDVLMGDQELEVYMAECFYMINILGNLVSNVIKMFLNPSAIMEARRLKHFFIFSNFKKLVNYQLMILKVCGWGHGQALKIILYSFYKMI